MCVCQTSRRVSVLRDLSVIFVCVGEFDHGRERESLCVCVCVCVLV